MNTAVGSALVVALIAVQGCRGPSPSPEAGGPAAGGEGCERFSGRSIAADTLVVGCSHAVGREHAPLAANESERLLFRQLYETLVRVDCRGRVQPGLADSWTPHDGGRTWEFHLRKGARFSDGSHLAAVDVRAAWEATRARKPGPRRPPWTWVRPDSVRTAGEDRLWVSLPEPLGDDPGLFANPELAVIRPGAAGKAPLGSGPYAWAAGETAGSLCAVPNPFHPKPGISTLCVVGSDGADPRDLLSGGVDLATVDDLDALEYAQSLPGVAVTPLPWSRLYLLLSPRFRCPATPEPDAERAASLLRDELASKVVNSDALPARSFAFDPEEEAACAADSSPVPAPGGVAEAPRILYWQGDPDAGRVAARLVALETASDPGVGELSVPCLRAAEAPVAAPVSWSVLLASLSPGADWAYVMSLRRSYPDPCLDLRGLQASVPWVRDTRTWMSLVVSRSHLVVKTGIRGVSLDWDGVPVLNRTGWDKTGTVP